MRKDRTLARILRAFAEAVEAGEFETAEGWLAIAQWVSDEARAPVPEPATAG